MHYDLPFQFKRNPLHKSLFKMDIDEALGTLGPIGKWQALYWTTLGFATMFPGCFHMLAIVFIGYKPPHRCKIPENSTLSEWIPYEGDEFSSCKMFANHTLGNETTDCMYGWEYLGDDGPTIVTKWDLVCEKDGLAQTSQTLLVFGVMAGAIVFTILADRFGRKRIFIICQILLIVSGSSCALTDKIYVFLALRFIIGAILQGIMLSGFVLMCELFSAKYRTFSGIMSGMFWALCVSIFPFIAMIFSNWFHLQMFISLLGLLTLPLFKYLPESPIWLCANNRHKEAEEIIKKAAKFNGLPNIPHTIFRQKSVKEDDIIESYDVEDENSTSVAKTKSSASYNLLDLYRNKRLAVYICISSLLWGVASLVYYGLTLSTAQIHGNRFWNAFINGFVEGPAVISAYFCLKRFGRKKPLIGFYFLSGISLLLTTLIPEILQPGTLSTNVNIVLTNVGKFSISAVFAIVMLYVSELFPTNLRNQSLGTASFVGRIGNFMATFVSYVIERYPRLPALLFGCLSITASFLVAHLPETHDTPLAETIEDIEEWFGNSKRKKEEMKRLRRYRG